MLFRDHQDSSPHSTMVMIQERTISSITQVQTLQHLAEATKKLQSSNRRNAIPWIKVEFLIRSPVEQSRVFKDKPKLENFFEVPKKIFPELVCTSRCETEPSCCSGLISIHVGDLFFEEIVKPHIDLPLAIKQSLLELGMAYCSSFYDSPRDTLLSIFHESEISFAGIQALFRPTTDGVSGIKRLFKDLKNSSSKLQHWKMFLSKNEDLVGEKTTNQIKDHHNKAGCLKPLEEDRLELMATTDGTLKEIELEIPMSPDGFYSKTRLDYNPCESMPILKEETQSSCETSRSIASRGGSLHPERLQKVSAFAGTNIEQRKSANNHKKVLKASERELEAALEDEFDSDEDESEIIQALDYIHFFFVKVLEEILHSELYLSSRFEENLSVKLQKNLEAKNQQLLNFISLRLMGASYESIVNEDFLLLATELPESPEPSDEDPTISYLNGVLAACKDLSLLSHTAAASVWEQVVKDCTAKSVFTSSLADFCEFRLLNEFLQSLVALSATS